MSLLDFKEGYICCILPPQAMHPFGGNLSVMDKLLSFGKELGVESPADDELVIHLRLGDVKDLLESEVGDILHVGRAFKGGVKCALEYLDTLEVVCIKLKLCA